MVKRGKIEIMRAILQLIQEHKNFIKPTPLLRKSGLSSLRFKDYYLELLERGLVRELTQNENKYVLLTDKGLRFLER